ncbi:MAG: response regulator [Oceanidesulfovibrio sp.]
MEYAANLPASDREQKEAVRNPRSRWDASCIDDLAPRGLAGMRFLVVSCSQHHARTDRRLLIRLGANEVRHESSGVRAARSLVAGKADCVILDGGLADMSGLELVRLIRLHPRTALMPVILASVENNRSAVLEALASGISGYLIRPYSMVGLARQIGRVLEQPTSTIDEGMGVSRKAFEEALSAYENAPKAAVEAEEDRVAALLNEVDELLRINALDAACEVIGPMAKAADPAFRAEACVRLAEIHRRRANPGRRKDALAEAGSCFQDVGEFERAAECFAVLQELNPSAPSPDEQTARGALQRRDFSGAARIYSAMLEMREPEAVCRSISRACMFTADPVTNARLLCNELGRLRGEDAETLYQRIVGPPPKPIEELEEREDRARGKLAEAVAVARYTIRAYREMKKQAGGPAPAHIGA